MKKKQAQSTQDPNQLNATFLLKFAKANYQAKNINFQMLNAFSNFLQHVSDSLFRQPQNYSQQIIKALIDIAITVQFNLHTTEDFLSFQIEPVLKFMEALFNFADKVFNYQQKPNCDKAFEIIDVFWPLLNNQQEINKVEVKQFEKIATTLKKITNLPYIYQIQPQQLKISSQQVLSQAIQISYLKGVIDFSILFRAALSKFNQKSKIFIESFLAFFEHLMNQNSTSNQKRLLFEKCLNILLNISNSIGQKYNYIQIFFNRMIKNSNFVRNFVYTLSSGSNLNSLQLDINIEKYYSNDHLLSISLIVLEKISSFRYINKEISDALTIISKLSQNWIDLEEKILKSSDFNKLNNDFVIKSLIFVNVENSNESIISALSQILKSKTLLENDKNPFVISQKKFQVLNSDQIKNYVEERISEEENNKEQNEEIQKSEYHTKIIQSYSNILHNLVNNKVICQKLKFTSISKFLDALTSFLESAKKSQTKNEQYKKAKSSSTIKQMSDFIIKCFPNLIPDQWLPDLVKKHILFNSQQEISTANSTSLNILYMIVLKKYQKIQSFSKFKQDLPFKTFIQSSFTKNNKQPAILNLHFLLYYLYFKRCSNIDQKQQFQQICSVAWVILQKLCQLSAFYIQSESQQKQTQEKQAEIQILKKKISTLEFFLILILDYPSGSFKLSLKKIVSTNSLKVGKQLDLNDLITINQKESSNNFLNSKAKIILGGQNEQNKLRNKFEEYVNLLNKIIFNKSSINKNSLSKQDKNLKIFITIKMNQIAFSINKNHEVPKIIENINMMRKISSINNLEILLFSFNQYFINQKQNKIEVQKQNLEESKFIVAFNYLLKIYNQTSKFNQKSLQQGQNDIIMQINTLKITHFSIQQSLGIIEELILQSNPIFEVKILIKLLKNIKTSTNNAGFAEKYIDLINQGQIVKLISQLTEDEEKLKIQFPQLGLVTMSRLIAKDIKLKERIQELKKIKLEQKQNKMDEQKSEQEEIIQEESKIEQFTDLSLKLKQLYLLYFPFRHQISLCNLLKLRLQTSILQSFQNREQLQKTNKKQFEAIYKEIIQDLLKNISLLKQITLKQSMQENEPLNKDNLWNFEYKNKSKFISFIINSVLKMFSNKKDSQIPYQDSDRIFTICSELLDNSQICKLAQNQVGNDLQTKLIEMISERVNEGIQIVKNPVISSPVSPRKQKKGINNQQTDINKQIKNHVSISKKLYNVVKKIISSQQVLGDQIINCIIQKDDMKDLEVTEFLIQEILNLAQLIKVKTESLAQNIFNYIMKVNESYKKGKQTLQIPEFLCQFFNICNGKSSQQEIKIFQKNQRSTNSCSSNPSYKCLKCDDKRLICYGCMIQCHKNHPVVYSNENKFPRCQCKQFKDTCKLLKKNQDFKELKNSGINNIFAYEKRSLSRGGRHEFFMGDQDRIDMPLHMYDDEQYFNQSNRFGQAKIRKPREFENLQKQSIFGLDPTFEKLENPFAPGPNLARKQLKVQEKFTEESFQFTEENYQPQKTQMDFQKNTNENKKSQIVSQSYLLPVFIQMFNEIYSSSEQVVLRKLCSQHQKFGFDSLIQGKIMNSTWKATNAGAYNVRLRKQNILNNKSPSVSKQVIAQNQKFVLIASGTMISVHLKERFLLQLLEGKSSGSFPNIHQHSVTFDIHTIDFSPLDDFSFCVAGLHNIILFTVNGEGIISRTNSRVNVNNDYINKVRTSNLGIFYSTSNQIRLLNWTFKQVLIIKSSSECLLKQWCVYEKNQSCCVYCVTSHGYIQYIDVSPSDQGRKVFTNKVTDGRKFIQTGASILVKDVEKIGKVIMGSFKDRDGTNLIGCLEGDTVQNSSFFTLRNNYVDLLGKKYLIGHSEIVKGNQNQLFVVCTIKQPLTPQNSINQGQLMVFKIRKDKKCQFNLINQDNKCEFFSVINAGDGNWAVLSLHDDGSLQFSILNKPQKQAIENECKKLKEIQPSSNQKNHQKSSIIKQSLKKHINQDLLSGCDLQPLHFFREFSDSLKVNADIKLNKKKEEYQIILINTNKVITGFSLPFFGNVSFAHRTVKNCVQVGLSNLQILHFYSEGVMKFTVQKIQDIKSGRDNLNQRFLEKLQRLQRYPQLALDSQRATQLLNSIKQSQASSSDQVQFYGVNFDAFKARIPNFNQIFNEQDSTINKDQNIQKMAVILKLFVEDSIQKQNYLCEVEQIEQLVKNLKKVSLNVSAQAYKILKELMVSALSMREIIIQTKSHVFNDEYYPLKYATQQKAEIYYQILKGQTQDSQIQEVIQFFNSICESDLNLGVLYLSKYPSLLVKLQKKCKKIQKFQINSILLKLYIISYQVSKHKHQNCEWILNGICSIFINQAKNKTLRESFYLNLKKFGNIKLEAWIKNINQIDGEQNNQEVNAVNKPPVPKRQQNLSVQNNMAALYSQFNMGQMDEQAMMRMAIELSQAQFKQNQQNDNFNFNEIIQEQKQNAFEDQMIMENQIQVQQPTSTKKRTLLTDLIEFCTKDLADSADVAISKIIVLYVVSKYVNASQNQEAFCFTQERILSILTELTPNCDNYDKHILMAYFSIFSNILSNSLILKTKASGEALNLYNQIKHIILAKLEQVKPEKVNKLKVPPNLLGKIFKGQKIYTFAHYSYGLVSLLLPPCQPSSVLLSLECYWLLPQSKQYYSKMKHMTTIKQGISTGNIQKIFQVSNQFPQIWRQSADIEWLQNWIEQRKNNWEGALNLLGLYYQGNQYLKQ